VEILVHIVFQHGLFALQNESRNDDKKQKSTDSVPDRQDKAWYVLKFYPRNGYKIWSRE
jgi:hypothetical protein